MAQEETHSYLLAFEDSISGETYSREVDSSSMIPSIGEKIKLEDKNFKIHSVTPIPPMTKDNHTIHEFVIKLE